MIDEAHKLRRDETGPAPDRPAREAPAAGPARPPATPVSPFGVDDDILRRAAALPGFATFRPVAQRPSPSVAPARDEPEPDLGPAPEAEADAPQPIEPEPPAGDVPPGEPDEPQAAREEPAHAVVFADADMVAPRRLDLTSIDLSLQRIADVLERRLGEIAERPHRLRDLGVAPRVPVPAPPEPVPAEAAQAAVVPEPPSASDVRSGGDAAGQTPSPAVETAPASDGVPTVPPAEPAAAPVRRTLGWGWAFLIGLAIFGAVVGAALSGLLPEPAGRLAAPLGDLIADWLARWR